MTTSCLMRYMISLSDVEYLKCSYWGGLEVVLIFHGKSSTMQTVKARSGRRELPLVEYSCLVKLDKTRHVHLNLCMHKGMVNENQRIF